MPSQRSEEMGKFISSASTFEETGKPGKLFFLLQYMPGRILAGCFSFSSRKEKPSKLFDLNKLSLFRVVQFRSVEFALYLLFIMALYLTPTKL